MRNSETPTYCIFDGLNWNSARGLGRFAVQLRRHLQRMPWRALTYSMPRWGSPFGRILLSEFVEPFWKEALAPQVAFYPHNVLPFFSLTHRSVFVLVLHDLLFLDDANKSSGNKYRSLKLKHSLSHADFILTVSESSRAEILKVLNRECPVLVLPNALAAGFDVLPEIETRTRNRPSSAKIIHFGGHAPSKNTKSVLKAIAILNRKGHAVHLVLASMSTNRALVEQWRQEVGLASDALNVLPSLSDAELKVAYADSDAHCMPSTGEGFGIPVIEAARAGVPNVLSSLPVFCEIMGEDAIYAESLQAETIASSILHCLQSDTQAMTRRARKRTDRYLFESVHRSDAVPALMAIEEMVASHRRKSR
jgi:glycosyltransferase involved in cell wall biosynthesis